MADTPAHYLDRLHAAAVEVVNDGTRVVEAARAHDVAKAELKAYAWTLAKEFTRSRDHDQCQRCGRYGTHDVHHRQPRQMGGTSDSRRAYGLDNLICLCRPCHEHVERNRAEAINLGYIVPTGIDPALTAWTNPYGNPASTSTT